MSQENVVIIRAGYAAWAERDLESWLETLHPEVEFAARRPPLSGWTL